MAKAKCSKKAEKNTGKIVKVAVIGCGARGQYVVKNLIRDSKRNVQVVAAYDPDREQCVRAMSKEIWDQPEMAICKSYKEAVAFPGVEWVMVFSPNAYHKDGILEGFKKGKHVFTEKPLATSIEDCQKIFAAHQKSGVKFATGFVLRFAPIYRKVKELLTSGQFGDLISIDANENITPNHGSYIMKNWRRFTSEAGPHILEKCCHDLDLINWFVDSKVRRIAAFGGRDFFIPKNKAFNEKYPQCFQETWWDAHPIDTPFSGDTDLMDNTVAIFEYRNNVRVQFQATMSNAIPERRMNFSCSKGNIICELYAGIVKWRLLDGNEESIHFVGDNHGGGDSYIMKELYEGPMCQENALPECSGNEGLESAVLALGIDLAARTGDVIDMEPIWKKLKR